MQWFENDDFWREFYPFMFSDERFAATPDEKSFAFLPSLNAVAAVCSISAAARVATL